MVLLALCYSVVVVALFVATLTIIKKFGFIKCLLVMMVLVSVVMLVVYIINTVIVYILIKMLIMWLVVA